METGIKILMGYPALNRTLIPHYYRVSFMQPTFMMYRVYEITFHSSILHLLWGTHTRLIPYISKLYESNKKFNIFITVKAFEIGEHVHRRTNYPLCV